MAGGSQPHPFGRIDGTSRTDAADPGRAHDTSSGEKER
jgi:hypothetical protein